jgi:putative ABC transport system ATP-binding protein
MASRGKSGTVAFCDPIRSTGNQTMSTAVLETRDLTRSYGRGSSRFDALKGVSLAIKDGESVAIVGKSGSGKSTLMHLLALLDRPSTGQVMLNGNDASRLASGTLNKARNAGFGFVFQQFFLIPNASVLENVMLPLKIAGVGSRTRKKRAMDALKALDMGDKARNRATDLSGGQKQRVVIARALVNNPTVIFADEPTGNLDTTTGENVADILFTLNKERGITLVLVTHDAELATRCDRSIYVKDGLIAGEEQHS